MFKKLMSLSFTAVFFIFLFCTNSYATEIYLSLITGQTSHAALVMVNGGRQTEFYDFECKVSQHEMLTNGKATIIFNNKPEHTYFMSPGAQSFTASHIETESDPIHPERKLIFASAEASEDFEVDNKERVAFVVCRSK